MEAPKVTVNIINQPPKDKMDDVGAEIRLEAIDFDVARDRILVIATVWSKTSRDATEIEATFRVPLPLHLNETLKEIIDLAEQEIKKTLCFSKTTNGTTMDRP